MLINKTFAAYRAANKDYAKNRNAASPKVEECENLINAKGKAAELDGMKAAGMIRRSPSSGRFFIQLTPVSGRRGRR